MEDPRETNGEGGTPDEAPDGAGVSEDSMREIPIRADGDSAGEDGPEELRRWLGARERLVRELSDELAAARLVADEARARAGAGELRVRDLEEEREGLRERLRSCEDEERRRRRRREGQERQLARLRREIERRETDISRLEERIARRSGEAEAGEREARDALSRKDAVLADALRRAEGLERDLEEREGEISNLRATVDEMRAELDNEYELRRRMSEPDTRIRAGIDLFNDSEHLQALASISRSLGQPEVHVSLERESDEPPVLLTFTWRGITWRTYAVNPGLAVREPRVYLIGSGEDLSGVDREPPNARTGPGGRVLLGL